MRRVSHSKLDSRHCYIATGCVSIPQFDRVEIYMNIVHYRIPIEKGVVGDFISIMMWLST